VDALLKADANGNLTKITHAEENYIAYQIGLRFSTGATALAGTTQAGLKASGTGTTVGTLTNTSFDDAVGSHDGSITTTSTTVTLKQTTGTAGETGADFHKPMIFDRSATGDVVALKAANDTELNTIVDRILLKTFANEHPGCRRLAASSPGGDWTAGLSNVFTDTRTDGTSINYTIWVKTSGTAPTKIVPQILHNDFDLKAMDEAEIQYTFGQRAKTRVTATGIGTYQLRNASQGVPTDSGTWVAKGTATDTKQQTADQNYNRTSTGNFVGNYDGQYQGNYVGNYDGNFVGDYVGNYDGQYVGEYTGNFVGNFTGNYVGTSTRDSTRTRITYFGGGNPSGYFLGNFIGNYEGTSTRASSRTSTSVFSGNYDGQYTRDSLGDYGGTFTRDSIGNYDGQYTTDSTQNFVGNYAGETIQSSSSTIDTYTLYIRTA
tara:strand:- start:16740 stop:18038 length:1299 start_codon:yes stop_codon:yes gene_type:complete